MLKGQKTSKETKLKISKANEGKKRSLEIRQAISKRQLGGKRKPCSEERKRKIGLANSKPKIRVVCITCNKTILRVPYRAKSMRFCSRQCRRGVHSSSWKGGRTKLGDKIRNSEKYKKWRLEVFIRDNFTCLFCKRNKEVSRTLEADHYPMIKAEIMKRWNIKTLEEAFICEKMWDVNNGRTLCRECHKTTPSYLNRWYVDKLLKNV